VKLYFRNFCHKIDFRDLERFSKIREKNHSKTAYSIAKKAVSEYFESSPFSKKIIMYLTLLHTNAHVIVVSVSILSCLKLSKAAKTSER